MVRKSRTSNKVLINSGQYLNLLRDIAEIESKRSRNKIDSIRLSQKKRDAAAFEQAWPDMAASLQERLKQTAGS